MTSIENNIIYQNNIKITSPGIRNRETCKNKNHPVFTPQKHQQIVLDYFPTSKYKGLLLYHKLGSGKSCTSIIVADKMLQDEQIKKVYVITPGSLRKNWLDEYCKKCGLNSDFLKKNFIFITYNYNIFEGIKKLDFNNSLIIIDEVHNLLNGVRNNSKNYTSIYDKIISSNCRVLVLTATIVFNNLSEWYFLIKLLKNDIKLTQYIQRDERKLYNIEEFEEVYLKSPEVLKGIISYYPGEQKDFPTVIYHRPINIEMSYIQEIEYEVYKKKEEKLRAIGPPKEELKFVDPDKYEMQFVFYIMAMKYIQTRAISNFYYPLDIQNLKKKLHDEEIIPDLTVKEGGWVSHKEIENKKLFDIMSPKFTALFVNILSNINSKQVVFTFFKEKCGVVLIHSLLKLCGIKTKLFTGDITDVQRSKILEEFNSPENRYGKKIKLLLLTEAGAEGINLLEVEHVHLLESSTVPNKILQSIGRAVRYKSHINLPKERQFVNVWKYHSVLRTKKELPLKLNTFKDYYNHLIINGMRDVPDSRKAIDSKLDQEGKVKLNNFLEFYEILQLNSIENGNI